MPPLTLRDPVDDGRIRSGQRRLIFHTASSVGLRTEQLYDLIECASTERTRALAQLSIAEARWVIGVLKTMERAQARLVPPPAARPGSPVELTLIRDAVRRGWRGERRAWCSSCNKATGRVATTRTKRARRA